ncbi:MAG: hypothetical protein WKF75_11210 [Singulisphaera sp.]
MSAEEAAACERAARIGYAVMGPGENLPFEAYRAWCRAHGIARVVVDDTGLYLGDVGGDPGAFARVHATCFAMKDYESHAKLAEMEASCRVCIRPDGPPSEVSVNPYGVSAIVPRALAVPLAARLYALTTRPEAREDCRLEPRLVDEPPIGLQQPPCPSPPSDIRNPKDIQAMNGENISKDTSNMSIENGSKDVPKHEHQRKPPFSSRPRPAAAMPPPADDDTDTPSCSPGRNR